jgi:hypothetical protein
MSALVSRTAIPPTSPAVIDRVRKIEETLLELPRIKMRTQHVIHAGLYARTITIPAGAAITGALIKRATLLIVSGLVSMTVDDGAALLRGYHVLPASAGRKQAFFAHEDTTLTMLFATRAQSIEEAEREFTDDFECLLSRHDENEVLITGE